MLESILTKLFQQVFFCEYCEIFKNTYIPKNIYERMLLNAVFDCNEEQHLLAKLGEMGSDKVMFDIYSYQFSVIRLEFYPEAAARRCSLKNYF